MPASLEERRLAVVEALRAVARERAPVPAAQVVPPAPVTPVPSAGPVEARLDQLSRQIAEVLTRLGSVETAVLESVWERTATPDAPAGREPHDGGADGGADTAGSAAPAPVPYEDEPEPDERVAVPKVPLGEGRMSSAASRALFGG